MHLLRYSRMKQFIMYITYVVWAAGVVFAAWYLVDSLPQENTQSEVSIETSSQLWISPYWIEDKLLWWFAQTRYSLSFRLYRLTRKETETLFKNLARLWVSLSWIWENKPYEWVDQDFLKLSSRLQEVGISVTDDEHLWLNFNHAKTYISDDERYLISTANLTYTSIWKNREYRYVWNDPEIAKSLSLLFTHDLKWEQLDKKDIDNRLLVCPDNCRHTIESKIVWSLVSIHISTQYLQDERVRDLLLDKSKEVDVKILLWSWQDAWWVDEFPADVVKILPEPYLHTKNLLIDNKVFLHGSMNLSENSLDNNREIGIVIEDPDVIEDFSRQFLRDWDNGVSHIDWNFDT